MAPTAEGAGVELAYTERGEGSPVLLLHGMAASSADWEPVAAALAPSARVIAPDRRGYGASGAPQPYHRTTVEEQAEDIAALLRGLDAGPALLCGTDFGALVCLDLVKRHRALVRGAVLVEPPVFQLVAAATEALAAERAGLETALRDAGPAGAVQRWVAGRGGAPERAERAREAPGAFFADYGALATWPVSRRELRGMDVPVVVLVPPGAPVHIAAAARALADLLPDARVEDGDEPTDALKGLLAAG
jgi:pimeloyl-ACP methyl ester carboxylesterase